MKTGKKKEKKNTDRKYDNYGAFDFREYGEYGFGGRNDHEDDNNDSFKLGEYLDDLNIEIIPKKKPADRPVTVLNRTRIIAGFLFLLVLMLVLVLRMGYWQIIKSNELKERAASMQKRDVEIDSVRGSIYDAKGNVLAETVTEYELLGYVYSLYQSDELTAVQKEKNLEQLSEITGVEKETMKKRLEKNESIVTLATGLKKDAIDRATKLFEGSISVNTTVSRYYPNGAFAAQALGGVDSENRGWAGLEYKYNSVLAGVKGRTVRTADRDGNTLANGSSKYYKAQDGNNLVTSLDSVIQHYVEEALEKGMVRTGAASITCIVMDPNTGEILAIGETPEYDPNNSSRPSDPSEYAAFKKMNDKEQTEYLNNMWKIEPVTSIYEPGSTFKLIAAAASLETGHSDASSRYYCGGSINVNGTKLNCLGSHGSQSLKVAVGNSCNAGFARVALDMGAKTFYNYIDIFGFRDHTGVDLPNETNSIVKDPSGMGAVDLATTGYGQGIAITPIQMLSAVNSLGNGGYLLKPRIVTAVKDKDGKVIEKFDKQVVRRTVSEETSDEMREIMEYYVSDAGGDEAYVPGFRIGGKTGTANIAMGGGYSSSTDCSFIAMAPMDDPVISMLVIVHKPTKTQYGNASAGPIVKSIMEKSLMYLGVEREYTDREAAKVKKSSVTVPKVKGMDSNKAIAVLKKKGLKYKIEPEKKDNNSFVVQDQYPKSGSKLKKHSVVYLYRE